jgi:hypothetical protein
MLRGEPHPHLDQLVPTHLGRSAAGGGNTASMGTLNMYTLYNGAEGGALEMD